LNKNVTIGNIKECDAEVFFPSFSIRPGTFRCRPTFTNALQAGKLDHYVVAKISNTLISPRVT